MGQVDDGHDVDSRRGEVVPQRRCVDGQRARLHRVADRQRGDSPVAVRASVGHGREPAVEVIVGLQARVEAEGSSLSDQALGPFSVARGGMGLSLVLAMAVLEAHDAQVWCIGEAQSLAALRLPVAIEEQ